MNWIIYIAIALTAFGSMEGVAWATHKYLMHGLLWHLHVDHHQKTSGFFERNDMFFLIFAIPSWLSIMLGLMHQFYWLVAIGAGISAYGAAYFFVHDIVIHQRFRLFSRTRHRYIKAIRRAHKMHHKHLGKEDGESFGMLWVHKQYWEQVRHAGKV